MIWLTCFWAGLVGLSAHVVFIKLPSLIKLNKVANQPFSLGTYLKQDWWTLLATVFTLVFAAYVFPELSTYYPGLAAYPKVVFILVGYMGSSVLQAALSSATKRVSAIIDQKTDIADGVNQ